MPLGLAQEGMQVFVGGSPAVYAVIVVQDTPLIVLSVMATARDAPEEEATEILARAAGLSPIDAESWVRRNISSGGQYFADGAEVSSMVPSGRGRWRKRRKSALLQYKRRGERKGRDFPGPHENPRTFVA